MPEQFFYSMALLFSLLGLGVLDHRFKLAFFYDRNRTIKTLALAVMIFAIWDIIGIGLNIFHIGSSQYLTGIQLSPEFPVEELFFLLLLMYNTLLLWRGGEKLWPRT